MLLLRRSASSIFAVEEQLARVLWKNSCCSSYISPQYGTLYQKRFQSTTSKLLAANPRIEQNLNYIMKLFENFIGLTEVKAAQAKVIKAEFEVKLAQEKRAAQQQRILELQRQLREIHAELDRTARGEDRYLKLITKEHAILKEERELHAEFKITEKREHDLFSQLSFALRESHEKERAQGEKTKYWSIIGSVVGTVLGIVATTINNQYRLHQLRKLVVDATSETTQCRDLILQIREALDEQKKLLKETANLSSAIIAQPHYIVESHRDVSPHNGFVERVFEHAVHLKDVVTQKPFIEGALVPALIIVPAVLAWMFWR